jgi:hypothetical protein
MLSFHASDLDKETFSCIRFPSALAAPAHSFNFFMEENQILLDEKLLCMCRRESKVHETHASSELAQKRAAAAAIQMIVIMFVWGKRSSLYFLLLLRMSTTKPGIWVKSFTVEPRIPSRAQLKEH